eukprot:8129316-Pyramimonas_sp.AAC.1
MGGAWAQATRPGADHPPDLPREGGWPRPRRPPRASASASKSGRTSGICAPATTAATTTTTMTCRSPVWCL